MNDPGKLTENSKKQDFQIWLRRNNIHDSSGNLLIADGVFGKKTGQAVRNFQKKAGLPQTGVVDKSTIEAMNSYSKTSSPNGNNNNLPPIKEGVFNSKIGMYQATIPEMEFVGKKGLNKDVRLFKYEPPESIDKIKEAQKELGLPQTGVFDKKTHDAYYKVENTKEQKQASPKYEKGVSKRNNFKDKIRKEASKINTGDNFGMKKSTKQSLKNSGVKAIGECIGGVCNFLDSKIEPGIFKGGFTKQGFLDGSYFSNSSFEKASREEGWQKHNNFDYTTPDIGDIVRVNYTQQRGRNHAMLVVDKNEKKNTITILDNRGDDKARKRTFTLDEFEKKFNTPQMKTSFYRRTKFDDIDIAEQARYLKNRYKGVPSELKPEKKDKSDLKLNLEVNDKNKTKSYKNYLKGIENSDLSEYKDIPDEDLKKIGVITAAIPKGESELGKGLSYKLESGFRDGARQLRKWKSGTPMSKTLSVGLSQINPSQLSSRIKQKYFKGLSDIEIEKKINKEKELQGKVSFDIMVDRYRRYRDSAGGLYGNDPTKFWYALTNSWQSPNKARNPKAKKDLDEYQWDYANNIIDYTENINVKTMKKEYGLGGELLKSGLQLGGNALFPGLGTALGAIAGNEMQNMEQGKIMQQHYNNVESASNPYQLYQKGGHLMKYGEYSKKKKMPKSQQMQKLQLGGVIDGALDNFQYTGNSHKQGGINVSDKGIPVPTSNKEVEGNEVTVKLRGKPSYVFSKKLKV